MGTVPLLPGVLMGTGEMSGNPDETPIHGKSNTPCHFML